MVSNFQGWSLTDLPSMCQEACRCEAAGRTVDEEADLGQGEFVVKNLKVVFVLDRKPGLVSGVFLGQVASEAPARCGQWRRGKVGLLAH